MARGRGVIGIAGRQLRAAGTLRRAECQRGSGVLNATLLNCDAQCTRAQEGCDRHDLWHRKPISAQRRPKTARTRLRHAQRHPKTGQDRTPQDAHRRVVSIFSARDAIHSSNTVHNRGPGRRFKDPHATTNVAYAEPEIQPCTRPEAQSIGRDYAL